MVPTPLRQIAAAIRGENRVVAGLALASGEFARARSASSGSGNCSVVLETPRPDSWVRYVLSPEVKEALAGLRHSSPNCFSYNVL